MNRSRPSIIAKRLGVDLLLGLASLLAGLALHLLGLVAGDRANDVVDLARDLVLGALGVALGLGGLDLSLALGVLLLASLLPLGGAGGVADGLLDGTSDRVVVATLGQGVIVSVDTVDVTRGIGVEESNLPVHLRGLRHVE